LLAVDSVTTLDILLDEMMTRSWPSGTEVRVLSIVEDGEVPLETWREEGYGVAAVRQEMRRRGEQISALAIERLREIGIPAEIVIMRGNPEFLISFAARKWPADEIFIRAHNRTDFRNWMLGSVARSVVDSAPCSVEVVRAVGEELSATRNRTMRILLATDGSDASLAAAQAVAETTWPENVEVKVVSVVNAMIYSLEEMGLFHDRLTERAHRAIGDAVQVLTVAPLKISGEVIAGEEACQVVDRAKNWGADLIIVGTHERQGLKKLLFGGTSAAVVSRAHCSVKVIRGRSGSRNGKSLRGRSMPSVRNVGKVYRLEENLGWRRAA
jgi:nucleotide-binding universal stress UspA family protein